MLYQISVYAISDIGLVRQNNEDSWKVLDDVNFFVIADGMGGHQAGEVASQETVDLLCTLFKKKFNPSLTLFQTELLIKEVIEEVNKFIYQMGKENLFLRGMGTTLCCVLLHPEGLIYAHVGDSRIYRLREKELEQLSRDHSLLRELIDLGQIDELHAENFLYKNIITKAIGTDSYVEPDIRHTDIMSGDKILICTDGVTDLISFEEIQQILNENAEENITKQLVKKAKSKGGYDNITAILVTVREKYEKNLS